MAAKTFIPKLLAILHTLCVYIVRYRMTIEKFLTPEQIVLLNAVVAACEAFTSSVMVEGGV